MERRESRSVPIKFWVFLTLGAIVLLTLFIGSCQSYNKAGAGEVNVIRNGGPWSSKDIREVRAPETGPAIPGLASEVRSYIAGSVGRFYKVSSDPSLGDDSGADFIQVPTKDGVNVKVDANIQFNTAFTNEENEVTPCDCPNDKGEEKFDLLIERFDTVFGNRKFSSKSGGSHHVYDGNSGWNAFLDSLFRPVVENSFREQIGSVNCADLVSSCALVQSSRQVEQVAVADQGGDAAKLTPKNNKEAFEQIAEHLTTQLEKGSEEALGDDYLTNFHVEVTRVTLPNKVQDAINEAQASFANIATAKAQKIQADYQAEANERLASAYKGNSQLAFIKAVESLKNSSATIILGEPGTGLTLGQR